MNRDTSSHAASPSPSHENSNNNSKAGHGSHEALQPLQNAGRGRGGGTTSLSSRVARHDGEDTDPYADEDADDWVWSQLGVAPGPAARIEWKWKRW